MIDLSDIANSCYAKHKFVSSSQYETTVLGKSLAPVLDLSNRVREEKHRLGLLGSIGVGKTAFSDSFIAAGSNLIKDNNRFKGEFLGYNDSLGDLSRYDCAVINDVSRYSNSDVLTEIVEHADRDVDLKFDIVVHIGYGDADKNEDARLIHIFIDNALSQTKACQQFVKQTGYLSADKKNISGYDFVEPFF